MNGRGAAGEAPVIDFLFRLFDTLDFPQRWHCGRWSAAHGWTHIVSDVAIFGAYTAIPIVLLLFVRRRRDMPFLPVFWLFAAFILSCGVGHLVEATIFWQPWYRLSGLLKVVTAIVSWGTVVGLVAVMPKALALRGPETIADQARRETGERFQALVTGTAQIVWTTDRDGEVREDSPSWRAFTGQAEHEFLGRGWLDALHPEDRGRVGGEWERAVAERATFATEYRVRHVGGEWRWTGVRAVPVFDPGGAVRGWVGMNSDITERKRAEERFRLAVEAAPSAMLMVDERGAIALVNTQAEQLFGYGRDELLGRSVEMLVPRRFRAAHPGLREGFFGAPATRAMGAGRDLFGLRRDGSEVPIEIGLNPIRTEEGPAVLASIIDITERVQAGERLVRSLREKEVLLKEIHHRVKNNLAAVGSMFYLQSIAVEDEPTLRVLRECQDRVRSMALVHERLYRSEDLASVDFAQYTDELSRQLVRNYVPREEAIRLELDLEPVRLGIDRAIPCGLILTELISNALQHAFPDGRSGRVRVELRAADGDGLTLRVADDGVGLPADARAPERRSFGLRLVQSLVAQIDGRVEFHASRPGTEARLSLGASDESSP